jgi:hypothetical protein
MQLYCHVYRVCVCGSVTNNNTYSTYTRAYPCKCLTFGCIATTVVSNFRLQSNGGIRPNTSHYAVKQWNLHLSYPVVSFPRIHHNIFCGLWTNPSLYRRECLSFHIIRRSFSRSNRVFNVIRNTFMLSIYCVPMRDIILSFSLLLALYSSLQPTFIIDLDASISCRHRNSLIIFWPPKFITEINSMMHLLIPKRLQCQWCRSHRWWNIHIAQFVRRIRRYIVRVILMCYLMLFCIWFYYVHFGKDYNRLGQAKPSCHVMLNMSWAKNPSP